MAKQTGNATDIARANSGDPTPWVMIMLAIATLTALAIGFVYF